MNVNRQRPLPPAADRDPFCGSVAVLRHRGLFQEIPFEISTMTRALLFLMIATLACAKRLDAQLAPEIGYVFPSGARAGTTVEVTIGGYDWTPDMQVFVSDPRVTLELIGEPTPVLITEPPYWFGAKGRGYAWPLPREFKARLSVPAEVPPGLLQWQAANANGVSPISVIQIGQMPEVLELAKHHEPQVLSQIPVTVSGQIRRIEEIDRYQIRPAQSGPITIELFARRLVASTLPMSLHGMLQVSDDTGRQIVDVAGTEGLDLVTTFLAEANRDYVISLHDVDFAGDRSYVYRLLITKSPRIVAAYPSAARRGETRKVELLGYGLATGSANLESVTREITFPADPAATDFDYVLETPFGKSNPYRFVIGDRNEVIEGSIPENSELPLGITGALDVRFGSKRHSVTMKKGELWRIAARSRTIEIPLDLNLSIVGPSGNEMATADDGVNSMDAELIFTVPEDGIYTAVVTDHSGHSGGRHACYRISFDREEEDFMLNIPDLFSLFLGSQAKFPVTVVRRGGFQGPIRLSLDDLPAGITVPEDLIIAENKNDLSINMTCPNDAGAKASRVTVSALARLNGVDVHRPIKSIVVAGIMKPRIKITPEGLDDVSKVRRGSTRLYPLLIDRREGFTGEIRLEMTSKQQRHRQGLASDEMIVPAEATRFDYPIFVPEHMETTKTSRMILNGAVTVADPKGNVRTLLQRMELRLGILPEGALMKLTHAPAEYRARVGSELTVPLTVSRVSEFRESLRIELVAEEDQEGLIVAEPVLLSSDEAKCSLVIRFSSNAQLIGDQTLLIRASGLQAGKWLVKSETELAVEVQPAESQ